jgi:hypothetical protein
VLGVAVLQQLQPALVGSSIQPCQLLPQGLHGRGRNGTVRGEKALRGDLVGPLEISTLTLQIFSPSRETICMFRVVVH